MPVLLPFLGPIVDKLVGLIPDPAARERAKQEALQAAADSEQKIITALLASDQAQSAVNEKEAQNTNLFVSGWRPFLGWVFGGAFAWVFVLQPVVSYILKATGHPVDLPMLDLSQMTPLVTGMLGLAGLRT